MDTTESIHLLLEKRFEILINCCTILDIYKKEVEELYETYLFHISSSLLKYYQNEDTDEYYRIVVGLDIEGKINSYYYQFTLEGDDEVQALLKSYNVSKINRTMMVDQTMSCDCDAEVCEDSEGSFTFCTKCGVTQKRFCVNTLYNSQHNSSHNNVKYFEKQFELKILGKGPAGGINDKDLNKIRHRMHDDEVFYPGSVDEVRIYLNKTNLNKYNKYATYIKYRLLKKDTLVISKYEYTKILQRIPIIIDLWSKYDTGKNVPYMYLGWKLIELFVKDPKIMVELLSNIHLPEQKTIRARDKTWKQVVLDMTKTDTEVFYQSTDKHLSHKSLYFP